MDLQQVPIRRRLLGRRHIWAVRIVQWLRTASRVVIGLHGSLEGKYVCASVLLEQTDCPPSHAVPLYSTVVYLVALGGACVQGWQTISQS